MTFFFIVSQSGVKPSSFFIVVDARKVSVIIVDFNVFAFLKHNDVVVVDDCKIGIVFVADDLVIIFICFEVINPPYIMNTFCKLLAIARGRVHR